MRVKHISFPRMIPPDNHRSSHDLERPRYYLRCCPFSRSAKRSTINLAFLQAQDPIFKLHEEFAIFFKFVNKTGEKSYFRNHCKCITMQSNAFKNLVKLFEISRTFILDIIIIFSSYYG